MSAGVEPLPAPGGEHRLAVVVVAEAADERHLGAPAREADRDVVDVAGVAERERALVELRELDHALAHDRDARHAGHRLAARPQLAQSLRVLGARLQLTADPDRVGAGVEPAVDVVERDPAGRHHARAGRRDREHRAQELRPHRVGGEELGDAARSGGDDLGGCEAAVDDERAAVGADLRHRGHRHGGDEEAGALGEGGAGVVGGPQRADADHGLRRAGAGGLAARRASPASWRSARSRARPARSPTRRPRAPPRRSACG